MVFSFVFFFSKSIINNNNANNTRGYLFYSSIQKEPSKNVRTNQQVVMNLFNVNGSLNILTKKIITKRWQDKERLKNVLKVLCKHNTHTHTSILFIICLSIKWDFSHLLTKS